MIVSVFVRRLKQGRTFEQFVDEWEADRGFGVPTRVFNAQSLDDPRDVMSIGFVDVSVALRCMCELQTEHDFTSERAQIHIGAPESLPAGLTA